MGDRASLGKPSEWPISVLDEQTLPDVQALFKVAFGGELDAGVYNWKYAAGRGVSMGMHVLRPEGRGELVAHYGGVWVPVQVGDGPACALHTAFQGTDAMVSPSVRDVFARFGPFGRLTQAFINGQVVPNGPAWYGFGFPNRRHLLLGERLGLYRTFESVHEFVWHLESAADALHVLPKGVEVLELDWADPLHLAAMKDLAAAHARVQSGNWRMVRSMESWRHRFANYPVARYKVWLVRQRGQMLLALATRQLDATRLELMDWMLAEPGQLGLLPGALAAVGSQSGVQWVQGWGTDVALAGWFERLPGATRHEGCVMVVNNEVIAGRSRLEWSGRVWVTGGDTDFR